MKVKCTIFNSDKYHIRVEDNKLYLFQPPSYSYFSFPLLSMLGDLGLEFSMT